MDFGATKKGSRKLGKIKRILQVITLVVDFVLKLDIFPVLEQN